MAAHLEAAIHHLGSVHRRGAGSAAFGELAFGILALDLLLSRLAFDELAFRIAALLGARRRSGERRECGDNQNRLPHSRILLGRNWPKPWLQHDQESSSGERGAMKDASCRYRALRVRQRLFETVAKKGRGISGFFRRDRVTDARIDF